MTRASRLALIALLACQPAVVAAGSPAKLPAQLSLPDSFAGEATAADLVAQPIAGRGWWSVFSDPALDALIERMHAGNTSIQTSAARLASANALARIGKASQRPLVGADAGASHASGPLINAAGGSGNLFNSRLSASWEIDLLGRLTGARKAERLDAAAAAAMLRDMRLLMEAATAHEYFQIVYLQQARTEAAQSLRLWEEREAIARRRLTTGLGQPLDLAILQRRSAASAARAAAIDGGLAQSSDALAFLVGAASPVVVTTSAFPETPDVRPGLPSAMLARRPDVEAAIDRLQAADRRLSSVRRNWFPLFALTGGGGAASSSLGEILSSAARNFGAGLIFSLPLFDGGRHKAQIAGSVAELELAKVQYREAMLLALRDVNDALAHTQATDTQWRLASQDLASSKDEQSIMAARADNGTTSRALLIEAQIATSDQRMAALGTRFERLAATIDLVKALGGGWSTDNKPSVQSATPDARS